MKNWKVIIAVMVALPMLLWSVSTSLDIEQKVHYLRARWLTTTAISLGTITNNPAPNTDYATDPVPAPHDHPPLRIVCGSYVFHVVYAAHDWMDRTNRFAMTDMPTRMIVLDRQRNAIEVREDVLHELMHIALWEAGGEKDYRNSEDNVIKPMAPSLRDILVDNPQLVRWLVRAGG